MMPDDITENPYPLFQTWLKDADAHEINDPNAMSLATVGTDGRPSNRMVLLNAWDERGFVFFTNSLSRKGSQIAQNPYAALCFHWKSLRKQIRVEGRVDIISDEETDAYFSTRPRGSQIGAWASRQSERLEQFSDLENAVHAYEDQYKDADSIPRPPHWNGYRVIPNRIEFWVNGEFRLHRRTVYDLEDGAWIHYMINP